MFAVNNTLPLLLLLLLVPLLLLLVPLLPLLLLLLLLQYDLEAKRVGFADVDCQALGQMPSNKVRAVTTA
jgi:hypothetical protein